MTASVARSDCSSIPTRVKSADGKHSAIDWFVPSPDNKYLGYGMSPGGSEESVLHIIEVASGKPTGDVIDRANFGNPSWLDGSRFVYNRLQKLPEGAPATDKYQNSRVYVHKMGDDPEKDSALIGVGVSAAVTLEPADIAIVYKPLGSDYMIVQAFNGTQRELRLWTAPVASLNGDKTPWVKIAGFERRGHRSRDQRRHGLPDDAQGSAALQGAAHVARQAGSREGRDVVVPPSEAVVTGIGAAKDALYVRKMNGGEQRALPASSTRRVRSRSRLRFRSLATSTRLAADPRVPGAVVQPRRLDPLRRLLRLRSADGKAHRYAAATAGQIR